MNSEQFEVIFEEQVKRCRDVLFQKAQEYATNEDRLHNFKVAAAFLQGTPEQALLGFAVKHFVSISDLVRDGELHPAAMWDEKIGDAINYLILLRAQIIETDEAIQPSIISVKG